MKHKDVNQIRQGRMTRDKDQRVRLELGLKFVGLIYVRTDWRAEPKQLFVGRNDQSFVKNGDGLYEPISQESTQGLSDDDMAQVENDLRLLLKTS